MFCSVSGVEIVEWSVTNPHPDHWEAVFLIWCAWLVSLIDKKKKKSNTGSRAAFNLATSSNDWAVFFCIPSNKWHVIRIMMSVNLLQHTCMFWACQERHIHTQSTHLHLHTLCIKVAVSVRVICLYKGEKDAWLRHVFIQSLYIQVISAMFAFCVCVWVYANMHVCVQMFTV